MATREKCNLFENKRCGQMVQSARGECVCVYVCECRTTFDDITFYRVLKHNC